MRLSIFSLLILVGCAGQVKRPDADICWVIAGANEVDCLNALTDYDDEGHRLPGAKFKTYPITLKKLNGWLVVGPKSQQELDRFRRESVKWGKEHCK